MPKLKIVIQPLCMLLIAATITTCSNDSYSPDGIKVFEIKSHFECGENLFYLDGQYSSRLGDSSSVDGLEGEFVDFPKLEKNQMNNILTFYISTEIWHYHHGFQNVQGATSAITASHWVYQLDFPRDEIGTYEFEPTEEEMKIFNHLIYKIISNQPESIQTFHTEADLADAYPPVIYLELHEQDRVREYFSTLSTEPCDFPMLFDFVATVLRLNRENSVPIQDMEKLQEINRKLMDIMSEYENDPNY